MRRLSGRWRSWRRRDGSSDELRRAGGGEGGFEGGRGGNGEWGCDDDGGRGVRTATFVLSTYRVCVPDQAPAMAMRTGSRGGLALPLWLCVHLLPIFNRLHTHNAVLWLLHHALLDTIYASSLDLLIPLTAPSPPELKARKQYHHPSPQSHIRHLLSQALPPRAKIRTSISIKRELAAFTLRRPALRLHVVKVGHVQACCWARFSLVRAECAL